jgi:hypothetical protein
LALIPALVFDESQGERPRSVKFTGERIVATGTVEEMTALLLRFRPDGLLVAFAGDFLGDFPE